jgi:diguanylate cyclase (GGDEF)-like protein/PAS domain S-box-containing protein
MGIDNNKSQLTSAAELRRLAEEQVQAKTEGLHPLLAEEEMQRLVHELEVHQIELEMQNAELRQVRDEVETALEMYTDLYDFAPVGYMTLDRDGIIIATNLRGASLLGIDRASLLGRRFGHIVTVEDRSAFTTFFDTVFASQSRETCEVTLLNEGKIPLIVQIVQIEASVDDLGKNCRLALIDITRRRRAEDALRESEERMFRLAEIAVDAIIMLDDSETVTFCNASAEKMFGCTAAEITGRNFHTLFIPERLRSTAKQGADRFRVQGAGPLIGKRTEVVALRKDGTEFPLELAITALNIKGKWHAIGIMRDVTARKQLEAEIQDAREYAENIVETVREPMVVLNSDLKILTANHSFYETFKVTPEATIGNFIYDLGNRQWDIPRLRVLIEEILPHDTVINGYEVEHEFPDIGRKIMLLNARQIFREDIGSRIILLAMEDITARKQLEAEIQDAREYAENIVETVREPMVVLNSDLKILTANHSFYETFKVTPEATIGNFIYDLGNRQWDIPRLRVLVEEILPLETVINGYEVEHGFPDIGRKIMLLNARQIFREDIGSHIILLAMEDITDRKLLEAEIQDAREFAENIVETVREPMVVLNSDLKILTANHSFYETFKVEYEETIGNFIYDLGNRQWDIPRLRVLVEEILPQDTVINGYEVEHEFPDIGRKIMLLNARQIFREDIGSHIILLAMEDITDRKLLEAEIQDAREYAENIVETVREPMVVLNSDLKILTANHSFYETFKVKPEATIGKFIYDLGNRQWDIPRLRVLVEEILPLDTVINGYEVEHDFPDIGRKIMLLNARQIFREDIGSHIILLAMEDITDRKLAEERISEVMRQQQAILDNIPNIAWLKDREGKYVAVNGPFSKSFGMTPDDMVGKSVSDIYPPELAVKYEKNFREVMATGTRTYFEESIVDREGKIQHMEKNETPIFNDTGVIIGVIGIAHDITSRKEVEEALRHDNTHDALTGLYNRAFFDEELDRFAHGRMFPLSIVMADVNGLKTINDTMGHDAGDNLIKLAARIILGAFRAEDIVARIGGDEFAVLLPETDTIVAEEAIKRIMRCPEITSGQVGIAFGIATAKNKDQLAEALKLSDERMYLDKSAQRKS